MKKMNPLWAGSTAHNSIDQLNERCVAWLCDASQWTKYKVEGVANYAIGSPSVEMYMKAFNAYKGSTTSLVCKKDDINRKFGYLVGANNTYLNNSGFSTSNSTIEAGPNNIFLIVGSNNSWWLASPSSYYSTAILYVHGNGALLQNDRSNGTHGVFPIASISQ